MITACMAFSVTLLLPGTRLCADTAAWNTVAGLSPNKTRMQPSLWARMPRLDGRSKVTILDAAGPGVVTLIHASSLSPGLGTDFDCPEAQGVIVRVFYDGNAKPAIEMPFMDFLGDLQCRSVLFNTIYFSKVRESHNFRLPMPFRKHIRIELENPSDKGLKGYADIQWDQIPEIPENVGHLHVDYRKGAIDARKPQVLFELDQKAKIAAHWLQYESEKSPEGEVICEANQEIYLDGDSVPSLNYLGTEDVYGYSWGFKGTHSDHYMAIIRKENLQPVGSLIAMLRCRADDMISFQKSCRWLLTFATDPGPQKKIGDSPVPFRHAVYYYTMPIRQ